MLSDASRLERATMWHVAIFVIGAAWMLGGRIYWAKPPLAIWGAMGGALTLLGLIDRRQRGAPVGRWLRWLLPPFLLAAWVLVSSFNPSFEVVQFYERQVLRPTESIAWLPSTMAPAETRLELAIYFGIFLSAFNLALNVNQRSTLRRLTLILGLNACLLALFGTFQKFAGTDMFFDLIESPNSSFFASFFYHNHWGPFALLNIAGWFGLMEHLSKGDRGRGFLHSPAFTAVFAILLIAITIPLSTSRSSTLMLSVITPICAFWFLWRFGRRRTSPISRRVLLGTGTISLIFCALASYWLAGDTIKSRIDDTREHITEMKEIGGIGQRARVYQDTTSFIKSRPIAGWGLESYAYVYRRYNTEPKTVEGWTVQFNEAHSDWLQILTETGFVGTGLFVLTFATPLWALRHRLFSDPFPGCSYLCLGLLAVYAWVEFPFANPAVTLSACVAFYSAIRYLQLGSSRHLGSRSTA